MRWDAGLPHDLVELFWKDPRALLARGTLLQDKPRCAVVRIDHPAGSFVWKHHNWGSLRRTVKRSLSRSTAEKSWSDGHFLAASGIPTPRPRAYAERRWGPFATCSYLLTDYVPGTNLYRLMRFDRPSAEVVDDLARQVAAIWQQLHDLRVSHNDLKPENLLVDPRGKVWLIDMERMRRYPRMERVRQKQILDADDLLHPRNWRADPRAAEVFRQAILRTPSGSETLANPASASHPLLRAVSATNHPSHLVTVIIPCRNAVDTIAACVESVRDMADEILVADAGSTDGTLDVVEELGGCRVITRQCADDVQFEIEASRAARHPWILRLLPNERLNSELGRQVQDTLAAAPKEDGFRIARRLFFRGQLLKFGGFQNDAPVRLYRKQSVRYEMRDGCVEPIVPTERIGRIRARLTCETCARVDDRLNEIIRHAARAAEISVQQGRVPRWRAVLWRAPWQFVRSYFLRFGWLDGWAGLHACRLSAFEVSLRETMLWELGKPDVARGTTVRENSRTLNVFDPAGESNARIGQFVPITAWREETPDAASEGRPKRGAA